MKKIAFAVLFLAAASLSADPPNAPPPTDVFIPSAGYRATAEKLLRRRLRAQVMGDSAAVLRGVLGGERLIPVIALSYHNVPFPGSVDAYRDMLFSNPKAPPLRKTMSQYFYDMSGDRLVLTGSVFGPYALPKDDTYYEYNDRENDVLRNGAGEPFGELLQKAFELADAEVDFGAFDKDGIDDKANSGDDDGKVDVVLLIQPEAGGECGEVNEDDAWNVTSRSHRYSFPLYGHNKPFQTNDYRLDKFGNKIVSTDGKDFERIIIEDFTIQPALACTPATPRKRVDVGIFCHEFGHALGIPDLYDRTTTGDALANSWGLGFHCLMSRGGQGSDGKHPDTPAPMSPWARAQLGWAEIQRISANAPIDFSVPIRNLAYRFDVPNAKGEYFLIEYRNRDPLPDGRINWNEHLPRSGIAIWHVDEEVGKEFYRQYDPIYDNWPFTPRDEGQNDWPSRPGTPAPSFASKHSLIALVQADGALDLENHTLDNQLDAGDFWNTGTDFRDDPTCRKGPRAYSGKPSGLRLASIDLAALTAVASIDDFPPDVQSQVASVTPPAPPAAPPPLAPSSAPVETAPPPAVEPAEPEAIDVDISTTESLSMTTTSVNLGYKGGSLPIEVSMTTIESTSTSNETIDVNLNHTKPAERKPGSLERALANLQKLGIELTVNESGLVASSISRKVQDKAKGGTDFFDKNLEAITGDLELRARPLDNKKENGAEALQYQQVIDVGGEMLPLLEKEVVFHYNKRYLEAVTANVVEPSSVIVTGATSGLTADTASDIVESLLEIDPHRIISTREGVFLAEDDPAKGRVVYEVVIAAGTDQEPLRVIIDQESQRILDIR